MPAEDELAGPDCVVHIVSRWPVVDTPTMNLYQGPASQWLPNAPYTTPSIKRSPVRCISCVASNVWVASFDAVPWTSTGKPDCSAPVATSMACAYHAAGPEVSFAYVFENK